MLYIYIYIYICICIYIYIYIDSLLLYICSERALLGRVILRLWHRAPAGGIIVGAASRPHGRLTFAVYMQ